MKKINLSVVKRLVFGTACVLVITLVMFGGLLTANAAYTGSYVKDGAKLLSQSEVQKLNEKMKKAYDDYEIGLYFLTTNDTGAKTAMEYADDYLDDLIDNKGFPEDSALFLIDMGARMMWISTTGKMIAAVNDADIDDILDGAIVYAADGKYFNAAGYFVDMAVSNYNYYVATGEDNTKTPPYIGGEYNDPIFNGGNDYYSPGTQLSATTQRLLVASIGSVIVFFLALIIIRSRYKDNGIIGASPNMHRTNLRLTRKSDMIVGKTVTHTVIRTSPPPSKGGTHFGSSSTHVSSAGRSHGGGGRSF